MERAPYFTDVAHGPDGFDAFWATTSDDVRIRVGAFRGGKDGTILLFPGRTEYLEKYGPLSGELAARGLSVLMVDWRGQGLADRVADDPVLGHVEHFTDFQKDVAAAMQIAQQLDLPKPWHLLGHSMGGAIGLRAVIEGLPVASVAFTAPMWGIRITPLLRPLAWALTGTCRTFGMAEWITPFTFPESYVIRQEFDDNMLTTDPEMYAFLRRQITAHPELGLGGPSLAWLYEAMQEIRWLRVQPAPDLPCISYLGGNERIVDTGPIHDRMKSWPRGRVEMIDNAEHEVLMEGPAIRTRILDSLVVLTNAAKAAPPAEMASVVGR